MQIPSTVMSKSKNTACSHDVQVLVLRQLCMKKKSHHHHLLCRSSRPNLFCKRGVLRNFAKFTKFCRISKNTFLTEHLWVTASDCAKVIYEPSLISYGTYRHMEILQILIAEHIQIQRNKEGGLPSMELGLCRQEYQSLV